MCIKVAIETDSKRGWKGGTEHSSDYLAAIQGYFIFFFFYSVEVFVFYLLISEKWTAGWTAWHHDCLLSKWWDGVSSIRKQKCLETDALKFDLKLNALTFWPCPLTGKQDFHLKMLPASMIFLSRSGLRWKISVVLNINLMLGLGSFCECTSSYCFASNKT